MGNVDFIFNNAEFDIVQLTNGVAQISKTFGSPGAVQVQANYSGDGNYMTSNASLTETVTAVPDFTISFTAMGTITPGFTGSSIITLSATGGFTGSIALTCSVSPSNLTDTPGCMFNQNPLTLSSTVTSQPTQLTFTTTAPSSALLWNPRQPRPIVPGRLPAVASFAAILGILLILTIGGSFFSKRGIGADNRIIWRIAPLSVFTLVAVLAMTGCGGSGGGGGPTGNPNPGTTPATYTVTITATSGSTMHTTNISVVVQ